MEAYKEVEELLKKKTQNIHTEEDREKCDIIRTVLSNQDSFFNLEAPTVIGMLEYLGVEKDNIMDIYFALISPENYKKRVPRPRITTIK